jgi:hypothetical protein
MNNYKNLQDKLDKACKPDKILREKILKMYMTLIGIETHMLHQLEVLLIIIVA